MTHEQTFPAYGFQRRVAEVGTVDGDGFVISHPQEPIWDIYLVTGDLDVDRLHAAWRTTCDDIPALDLRMLRHEETVCVLQDHVPAGFDQQPVNRCLHDGRLTAEAAAAAGPLTDTPRCAPHVPAAHLRVLSGADGYLVIIAIDHSVADGWSLGLLVKRLAVAYRREARARPLGSFPDFLQRLPDADVRAAQLRRWRHLLRESLDAGPTTLYESGPGQVDRFTLDSHDVLTVPADVVAGVRAISRSVGGTGAEIWTAVAHLAATRCSTGPQSCINMSHGRNRRQDLDVFGPLLETHILPGVEADETVAAQWKRHRDAPALWGQTLREAGLLGSRRFAIDHVPQSASLALGSRTQCRSLTGVELEPLRPPLTEPVSSQAGVWISIFPQGGDSCEVLVQADSRVLPDATVLVEAMLSAVHDGAALNTDRIRPDHHILAASPVPTRPVSGRRQATSDRRTEQSQTLQLQREGSQ